MSPNKTHSCDRMPLYESLEEKNKRFAASFEYRDLPLPPSKHLIVLTCMDARLDVLGILGLEIGEAHIIRNGGGRARDAMRSIVVSQQMLETREVLVMHHTDCGLTHFKDDELRTKIHSELGVQNVQNLEFHAIENLQTSVQEDVAFIKDSPLTLDVPVTGYIYDIKTGKISRVV